MKKSNLIGLILFGVVSLSWTCSLAQSDDGGLKAVEIEIVKEREITLPQANRLFDKIPPRPAEPIKPEITYAYRPISFATPQVFPAVRPLRLKDENQEEINGGFLSLGYGNYASPFLEGFINSKRDKNKLIGAHGYLNSSAKGSVDGKNSGSGNSGIFLFAQSFGKDITFQANGGFENRTTHFFGYPEGVNVLRDTIKQSYNLYKIGLTLANARNTEFSYELGGNFSFLSDAFSASESSLDLNFNSAYAIQNGNKIEVRATYALLSRKDIELATKGRSLFQATAYYSWESVDNLKLQVGATLALENDTLDTKDFHLYPDVKATYTLSPTVDLVGSLTGGIDKVSLQSLVEENLWIAPSIPLNHTNKLFDVQAALNARLSSNVFVSTGLSFANLKNFYFFVNSETDQAKFNVLYDEGSTNRTNLFAALGMNFDTRTRLSVRGDYFTYSPDTEVEAWHRPGYSLNVSGSYNLKDKIVFNAEILALGNIKARDPQSLQTVKLDPAFDLNFRVEYFVSKRFSAFVELNNVIANPYQVYLNYPVRGFQAMGGVTWSF